MGIFGSFKRANQVLADAKKDVKKKPTKDEVGAKRQQKNSGGKK